MITNKHGTFYDEETYKLWCNATNTVYIEETHNEKSDDSVSIADNYDLKERRKMLSD